LQQEQPVGSMSQSHDLRRVHLETIEAQMDSLQDVTATTKNDEKIKKLANKKKLKLTRLLKLFLPRYLCEKWSSSCLHLSRWMLCNVVTFVRLLELSMVVVVCV
jgi:hypothetical protein